MNCEQHWERCIRIDKRITYKPQTGFSLVRKESSVFVSHWQDDLLDVNNNNLVLHKGRKFYLSPHMTDEEVIRTFALAVKIFEEHEANEWLKFDNRRVLNPHPEGPRPTKKKKFDIRAVL